MLNKCHSAIYLSQVLKTSGFFEGLFEEDELVSENVKDRDSKLLFLNKVISVVGEFICIMTQPPRDVKIPNYLCTFILLPALTTGRNVSIKASKIVAGQEPEKTNELLQNIAYALDKKLSSDEAVKKFKENSNAPHVTDVKTKDTKPIKKNNEAKKITSRSSEKLVSIKKESTAVNKPEKNKISDPKSKKKDSGLNKNDPQVKKTQNLKNVGKKASVENIQQTITSTDTAKSDTQEQKPEAPNIDTIQKESKRVQDVINTSTLQSQEEAAKKESDAGHITESDHDSQVKVNSSYTTVNNSSLSSQDLMEIENENNIHSQSYDTNAAKSNETTSNMSEERTTKTNTDSDVISKEDPDKVGLLKKPRPALIPKHNSLDSEIKAKELIRNNSQDNPVNTQTPEFIRPASVRPSSSRPGAPRLREKIDIVIPDSDNLILGKVNIIAENAQIDEVSKRSMFKIIIQPIYYISTYVPLLGIRVSPKGRS